MAIGNPINLTSNVEGKNISVIATAGQTQFTVTGGYRINQISVFRNGVRLVDGRDFTALDGTIVTLLSAATVADVIEFQVFDDFRVSDALNVNSGGTVNGNVTVTGILSTTNLSIGSSISLDATTGIITAVQVIGGTITGTATTATNAEGLTGTPDITVNNIVAAAATFSGVVTYEDITNIDSIGIVTARTGVDITANGLVVNAGVSTFGADLSIADKIVHSGDTNTAIRFPSNDKFTVETAGVQRLEVDSTGDLGLVGIATATGLVVVAGSGVYAGHTGIITAVTFDGALSGAATQVTVADESSDTTCFPLFTTAATGDLAPKSGTNLTFNSSSGALTATSFVGALTGAATQVTVADESSDTSCNVLFTTAATGDLAPKSGTNLTFNSSSGALTATSFVGALTGNSAGSHTGAVDLNGGVLTLDADADTTITADTDDQIDIAFGGNDRITLSTGLIDLKNDGSQSAIRLYCESSNAHYAALQAPAHSAFSGNITLTLPATTDTLVGRTTTDTLTNKTLTDPTVDDKIIHTGDTNTAIRFPAADTFTVETGGDEALRVDSSQRVLLGRTSNFTGTNAQYGLLQISGNSAGATGDGRIVIGRGEVPSAGNQSLGQINFVDNTAGEFASIKAFTDGSCGTDDYPGRIEFHTTPDGSPTPVERLQIDSSGNLNLVSSTSSLTDLNFTASDLTVYATVEGGKSGSGVGDLRFYTYSGGLAERLRITSGGNVSIVGDNQKLLIGAGDDIEIYHSGSASFIHDNGTGDLNLCFESGSKLVIQSGTSGNHIAEFKYEGAAELFHNGTKKFETTSAGVEVSGKVESTATDLPFLATTTLAGSGTVFRSAVQNAASSSNYHAYFTTSSGLSASIKTNGDAEFAGTVTDSIGPLRRLGQEIKSGDYTLVAGDAGKHIRVDGNHTITVPDNVFTSGDMVTIVANSSSTVAVNASGSLTLYNASDGTAGNRTMAARTVATILIAEGGSGSKAYISGGGLS